jgi:hypothetical protein
MARSAVAFTIVFTFEELLPGVESGVDDVTVAVLLSVLPFGAVGATCAVMLNVAVADGASAAMLQEIVGPVVQVNAGPVVCDSETNVVLGGSVSLQLTVDAVAGPLFVTVTL